MSSANQNLSTSCDISLERVEKIQIGIVRSQWNQTITQNLLDGCRNALIEKGILASNIQILEVPGAFELPYGGKLLMKSHSLDAVIYLGCVIKGETNHDDYINQSVAHALTQMSIQTAAPHIFGLLTVLNEQQAIDRSGGKYGNKGIETAMTALQLIKLSEKEKKTPIGFGS